MFGLDSLAFVPANNVSVKASSSYASLMRTGERSAVVTCKTVVCFLDLLRCLFSLIPKRITVADDQQNPNQPRRAWSMRFQLKADDARAITAKSAAGAVAAGLLAVLWAQGIGPLQECAVIFPSSPPQPTDAAVAALGTSFEAIVRGDENLSVSSRGELKRDLDTTFWALLADHFGSNPNTPCTTNDFSSPICAEQSR